MLLEDYRGRFGGRGSSFWVSRSGEHDYYLLCLYYGGFNRWIVMVKHIYWDSIKWLGVGKKKKQILVSKVLGV